MTPEITILTVTAKLAAKVDKALFVTASGALPAADGAALGVAQLGGAANDLVPVVTLGVARVTAGGVVAAGDAVACAATGKAIKAVNANAVRVGRALTAAAADGDEIQVHLIPN